MGDKLSGPLDLFASTFCNTFKTSFSEKNVNHFNSLSTKGDLLPVFKRHISKVAFKTYNNCKFEILKFRIAVIYIFYLIPFNSHVFVRHLIHFGMGIGVQTWARFFLILLKYILIENLERPTFNPYSAGIDFSRQNLTSVDVRFWRLKSIPAL